MNRQVTYFPKQTLHIITELQPNGEYTAICDETYDGPESQMGFGDTRLEAIADLCEQLVKAGIVEGEQ
jgi:hypothetical protein